MPIIAREPETKFAPAPEGLHQAVCVDVHDEGIKETQWGDKHKVLLVWQLEVREETPEGRRHEARGYYTLSLSEKANLRIHLECWRGRKFTAEELEGFDLEKLIGVNCQLQIAHNLGDKGKTYANIQAIVPFNPKLGPKLIAEDYTRIQNRAKESGAAPAALDDDDIPF